MQGPCPYISDYGTNPFSGFFRQTNRFLVRLSIAATNDNISLGVMEVGKMALLFLCQAIALKVENERQM